ncbi:MAG: hypothetical protein ACOYNC_18985 [Bacteroidales bacterium]
MKHPGKKKGTVLKIPVIDPDENEKYLKKLEIQKAVIQKIMDPINKQILEEKLKEEKNWPNKK